MLRLANRELLEGTALLGLAIAMVTFLITDILFGDVAGTAAFAAAVVVVTWIWFGLPISRKVRDGDLSNRGS